MPAPGSTVSIAEHQKDLIGLGHRNSVLSALPANLSRLVKFVERSRTTAHRVHKRLRYKAERFHKLGLSRN